jgi:hypothetical protein
MSLEKVFRFSNYLTLAVATLAVSSAEDPFLPEINYFLIPVETLLVVAFLVEGRWALTLAASNAIGVLIAAGSGIWIARSLMVPSSQLIDAAPYPAALLPYCGPVLMIIMLAKLFRPKDINDYWGLQLIGLMEVALGCILGGELAFSFWLFAYVACALWSLMLFYFYRECKRFASPGGSSIPLPWRGWAVGLTWRRAVMVLALGIALFWLAPRNSNRQWNLLNPSQGMAQMETGYSSRIDLSQTGPVKVSEQVAMHVYVQDSFGRPVTSLNPGQRWRGATLDLYDNGRWSGRQRAQRFGPVIPAVPVPRIDQVPFPPLGPQAVLFTFEVDALQAGGLFLAEPVLTFDPDDSPLVRSLGKDDEGALSFVPRNGTLYVPLPGATHQYRYQQLVAGGIELPNYPAGELTEQYKSRLLRRPIDPGSGIREWCQGVLKRLVKQNRLSEADLVTEPDPEVGDGTYLLRENRAKVARALSDYLAFSGEYAYKLEMRRTDPTLDPAEDFLRNVKQGFCEHFATGLALMLRSVGIRARVVSGFRGADAGDEQNAKPGHYYVRQSHAHSWVEALITFPGSEAEPNLYWLTLDPTPYRESGTIAAFSWTQWWQNTRINLRELWKGLILDYNLEKQGATVWALWSYLRPEERLKAVRRSLEVLFTARLWTAGWLCALAIISLGLAYWVLWRRRRSSRTANHPSTIAVPFYASWLEVLTRQCGLRPAPSQTAHEFAMVVSENLHRLPGAAHLTALPRLMASWYYRVRYGHQPLPENQNVSIQENMEEFESVLSDPACQSQATRRRTLG